MKKYIYLLLTKGSDERFVTSAYETLEGAQKALEMNVAAQKDIESLGGDIYVDYHKLERLRLPEFATKSDDIIAQVSVHTMPNIDGKVRKCVTERYIIKVEIN